MDIIYHHLVAKDMREISRRYVSISDELNDRFWGEFDDAIDRIRKYPEAQHYDPSGKRRRNLKKFPYHILFEQHLSCVRVMAVRHHRRNPSFGLRRK